jgi:hypothetical protein
MLCSGKTEIQLPSAAPSEQLLKAASHLFHKSCAHQRLEMLTSLNNFAKQWTAKDLAMRCPHCGSSEIKTLRSVTLRMRTSQPPVFHQEQNLAVTVPEEPLPLQTVTEPYVYFTFTFFLFLIFSKIF